MSFETDIQIVESVLVEMQGRFDVANPVGLPTRNCNADAWQIEARAKIANSNEMLQYIKVPIDATFYRVYGDYIADKTRNAKQATHLKCFDFNAYVSRRLADKGFTGSIRKGLLGTTTLAGHEFLLLFWECEARYRRILDVWSHLQTSRPALCIETDYAALLPQDKALQAALVKGVVPKLELKNGTCPTSGS